MNPVSAQIDITLRYVYRSELSGIMPYYELEYDYNNIHVYAHCIIFRREISWLCGNVSHVEILIAYISENIWRRIII